MYSTQHAEEVITELHSLFRRIEAGHSSFFDLFTEQMYKQHDNDGVSYR